ncbi:MAG: hypothetical protein ACRDGD_01890 [Candidatus Limnocylindria bacterium]
MPFLPFVLLLAWQALSRSASFALGWATALYFGQVPGRQGRMLAVISLVSAGWVIVIIGFAIPILGGALLEAIGLVGDNFDVAPIHHLGLAAAIVLAPPFVAAVVVFGEFHEERSIGVWLRLVPVSYPATFMLGLSVLQMVLFTPILLFQRWRRKRTLVQVPLVMREGTDDDDLLEAVRSALAAIDITDVAVSEATGPKAWPMRTVGFAARHLLGAVVRGVPVELRADGLEIYAYATNVSILGPKEDAYVARAAVERELALSDAYLTWNEESQGFEDELLEAHRSANTDLEALRGRLDEVQQRMDRASLNSEEWNVLYRLRLQVEQSVSRRDA